MAPPYREPDLGEELAAWWAEAARMVDAVIKEAERQQALGPIKPPVSASPSLKPRRGLETGSPKT